MSETNPRILPRPARWSALQQYFAVSNGGSRKPYLIIFNILKRSFNDNEIIYCGSWTCLLECMYIINPATSTMECFAKIFNSWRSSHQEVYYKNGILKNLAKFTKIHLWKSLLLIRIKASSHKLCKKKENPVTVFSGEVLNLLERTPHMYGCIYILLLPRLFTKTSVIK